MTKQNQITPRQPRSPEEYERTNVALAMKLSSERLRDGSASAQEIIYWLKIGSTETELNRRYLETQILLNEAKVDEIKSAKRDGDLYEKAIKAITAYRPTDVIDGEFEEI